MESAVRAAGDDSRLPGGLDSLLIVSPFTKEMVAWVRSAPGSDDSFDIDLCDERGNIAAQIRGLSWQLALPEVVEPVHQAPSLALVRKEIVFASPAPKKRAAVSLAAPGTGVSSHSAASTATRARITLSSARQDGATLAVSDVRLYDRGHGVFSIDIGESPSGDVISSLCRTLEMVQREASLKVLLLSGAEGVFVGAGREAYNEAVEHQLYQKIVSFPYPVVAILHGDVAGPSFMAAALCDFMVCNEDANYGYTDAQRQFYPTTRETRLFCERFGAIQAHDFLYLFTTSTGRQLRTRGWTCPILPPEEIGAYAANLALTLADKSQDALRLLKRHLTRRLADCVNALTRVEKPATEDASAAVAVIRYGKAGLKDPLPARAKAIVIVAEDPDIPDDVVSDVQRFIIESEVPVVAALAGDARDNAWLVSQFSDACVYSKTGVFSAANIPPTGAALFGHRLGNDAAKEILLTGGDYRGTDLEKRVGTLIVAEEDRVLSVAMEVAESWAKWPRAILASWKQDNALIIGSLPPWEQRDETPVAPPSAPVAIPLQSRVVTATAHPGGIVVVKMEDREARNMFSDALIAGVTEAFAHIEQEPAYKVVILTGYDSYFAAGGTKESLLAVQEGKTKFTDVKIVHLPLDCKLPVIAAMQGHGLGAGWTMGMFADLVLMSEEGRYVSPYMSYGFTPGAGATWILAEKIGTDLARESLFTGRFYTGAELKERGLRLPILPRSEVVSAAMALAKRIALAPRGRLISLKRHWTLSVREAVEETYRLELEMHEKTFVGRPDTLARIQMTFRSETESRSTVVPAVVHVPAAPARFAATDTLTGVRATLRTLLANELQMREADIDENTQFIDLGLDSISGVTWVRKINETYRTSIVPTKVYSYPTLTELARHVHEEAEKQGALPGPVTPPAMDPPVPHEIATRPAVRKLTSRPRRTASPIVASAAVSRLPQPIAIVGMAGQFPQARNLDEFWQNLAQGRNCISQVPRERWDVNAYYQRGDPVPGKTNSQWLGALDEYDQFDPLFFNISPTEAEFMDPQQRVFLQACWHAIEDAGYAPRALSGSKCGVFVGCASGDYHQLSRQHHLSALGFTGNATSILAARISYFLNLQGPCISIDTACSSSLVAIAQGCDSLNAGGSDLALAGGVYVMAGPDMHIRSSQTGMLSPEGKCFTFDQRADGFVPGEGVGVVMLKRLADAQKDGDIVSGVIHGWGINQDGKTNGITAPNPESQTRLEQDVYDRYEIDPANIRLIEAHGTGTKLGDPIEIEGLKKAFAKYTQQKQYCALGSVKSNIGHCLTAAGIAGVIKLLLALKHKQLPPTINFEQVNEHIDLTESPFYVNTRLREWELDGAATRLSAVSSFGFSGTNAHIVIGELLPPVEVRPPVTVVTQDAKMIVPLSARKPKQLKQKASDLLAFVRKEAMSADLIEIAYTLQVGREAMDERVGFLVSSVAQLAERLQAYVEDQEDIKDFHQGQVKRGKESISIISEDDELKEAIVGKWIAQKKLLKLLDLWTKGLELDWNRLYGEAKPRRIGLPGYPFAKERYWIDAAVESAGSKASSSRATAVVHPLLHANNSDLTEHRYSSTFDGD
ncbi:MAG: polyketide synthase, partial [Acidobacteriota bacterium]